jgi:hypothetical protein
MTKSKKVEVETTENKPTYVRYSPILDKVIEAKDKDDRIEKTTKLIQSL